ncbi:hypothetical protein MPNT_370007 [Candidatus Methylacidithermus pantelleriae]|uniref:Uncharacterized protein n=1 Tax=Candidatus Methylacidithermus pantelleriae TaxID=2744239 RepID=A0A8J2BPX3_9BACT|nr:hypothetical protein MPNT_370007 [Candidatus Methylacidithermus pantelleriae]
MGGGDGKRGRRLSPGLGAEEGASLDLMTGFGGGGGRARPGFPLSEFDWSSFIVHLFTDVVRLGQQIRFLGSLGPNPGRRFCSTLPHTG